MRVLDTTKSEQRKKSLLTNRNYGLLWLGQSFSFIGDYFFSATITLWIIDKLVRGESWLPLATGGVAISMTLPSLLLAPLAGVFVDRWNQRLTMLWTDLLRMVVVLIFLFMTLVGSNSSILLICCFLVLLFIASGSQFFLPAREAVVADLVPQELHPRAYGSLQQARYFAQILGPSVSAPLYLALGPTWAIALNAASFLLSFLFIWLIRLPTLPARGSDKKSGFWQEFQAGLHFFISNRVLITLVISGMLYMIAGMAYNSFEYLYGIENLHVPAALLGVYVACYGIGVVVGLPIIAALARRVSEVEVLWICLICTGVVTLILSRATTPIVGMICGFLLGCFSSSIFISVRPLTVLVTPREMLGRVMAVEMPLITGASVVGGLLASTLASTALAHFHIIFAGISFGQLDTIFAGVGILTIGTGVFARLTLYPAVKAVRARRSLEQETPVS